MLFRSNKADRRKRDFIDELQDLSQRRSGKHRQRRLLLALCHTRLLGKHHTIVRLNMHNVGMPADDGDTRPLLTVPDFGALEEDFIAMFLDLN